MAAGCGMATITLQQKLPHFGLFPSSVSEFHGARLNTSVHYKRKLSPLKGSLQVTASGAKKILIMGGREAVEVEPILDALPKLEQYIYCSSAGVYLKSDVLPHNEVDAVDPKSRHKGKLKTKSLLESKGVNWTSIRPVYMRPIPIPGTGLQVTQLGHVKDLAKAFVEVLGNEKASREVFNISGDKYVTFDGLARACGKAGGFPEPELVHYNPKDFDFGKKKSFPFRDQGSKPWRYTGKEKNMDRDDIKMLIERWREIYHDSSLNYRPEEERRKTEAVKRAIESGIDECWSS
ncbi:Chloroplast stem-loop binding protein of 41 kDa b, chloroplastic-like protein [Drosera capensis]